MIKYIPSFDHKIGDHVFHFLFPHGAAIEHVKEALAQFMAQAINVEKEIKDKLESKDKPVEAPKEG